jgi:hypothetical protein
VEPYDLYSSPDIIRMIKSGQMRWAGLVKLGRDYWEDLSIDGRIILK